MMGRACAIKVVVGGGCAAMVMAVATSAQTPKDKSNLETVIVTAQRRSEVLERVPMSVAVVSAATISKTGAQNIHDLNQLVAGATVSFAGCCSQPAIRGISTLTTGVGFENNVAIYVDGFYVPDNLSVNGDLANISSIEVLKGPQGALWGRNATGGAILINTAAPSRTLTGDFEAGYGNYNEATTKAYISGPLTDRLRFSIAEASRTSDGYDKLIGPSGDVLSHSLAPIKQITVRAKLLYEITDWLTATAGYNYADSDDPRTSEFSFYDHIPAELCIFQCYPTASLGRPVAPYTGSGVDLPRAEVKLNEGTFKLVAQTPFGDLTSNTGFAHRYTVLDFDFDDSVYPLFDARQHYAQDTFQDSLTYNVSAIDNLNLVVGAEYLHDVQRETEGTPETSVGPLNNLTSFVYTDQQWSKIDETYALYFDGTYHITNKLSIDVGGRYSHDYTHVNSGETGIVAVPFQDAQADFSSFTPRASLRYELAKRTDIYVTYSQGYRNGGFNPVPPLQTTPFAPEKIKSYELGFKTAQSWYEFDSAVFYYDYTNLQVGVVVTGNGGTTVNDEILNAKAAELYGWDNNLVVHPVQNGTVRAGLEMLHARYTNFDNYSGIGVDAATGQDVSQTQNLNGKRMIRAPDVSGFVGGDYDFQNVFGGDLDAATNVTFTSEAPTENASLFGPLDPGKAGQERYIDPAYALWNATLTWRSASGHYKASLYARNITSTQYRILNSGTVGFGDFRGYGEPATYGFRVGYSF